MSEINITPNNSPAAKIIMVYEDGSTREFDKGVIIAPEEIQPGDTEQKVTLHGLHMSGNDMIDMSINVMMPILQSAFPDVFDEEDEE